MCDCEKKLETDRGVEAGNPKLVVRKLARMGTKLLHSLPSERDCVKIEDTGARTSVAELRNFALDASQANSWDQRELENFSSAMALAGSVADALLGMAFAEMMAMATEEAARSPARRRRTNAFYRARGSMPPRLPCLSR